MLSELAYIPMLAAGKPEEHVIAHDIVDVGGLTITNHMMLGVVVAILVFLAFSVLARAISPKGNTAEDYVTKGRFAQVLEVLCEFIRENVARPNLGPLTDKYIYFVWSTFFFILFANLIGMVPIGAVLGLINPHWSHWGGTPSTHIMITGGMAVIALFMIVFVGLKENGMGFIKHFAPVPLKGPMIIIGIPLIFLEVLGVFIKCTVLAVRLFGNLMAGHLVVAALIGIVVGVKALEVQIPLGIGVIIGLAALSMLELFIAFLQAFIFTMLMVIFISSGAVHHGDHGHDDHAVAAH